MIVTLNVADYPPKGTTILEAVESCRNYIKDVMDNIFETEEKIYPLPLKNTLNLELSKYIKDWITPKWSDVDLTPTIRVSRPKEGNDYGVIIRLGNDFVTWRFKYDGKSKKTIVLKCETQAKTNDPQIQIPKS